MARTVFIIGAGFSKDAGGPLMTEFFQRDALRSSRNRLNVAYDELKDLRRQMMRDKLITDNVEEFFNILSESDFLGMVYKTKYKKSVPADKLLTLLVDYICKEIELRIDDQPIGNSPDYPNHYFQFAGNCLAQDDASVITFNYDLVLERTLAHLGIPFDYGFPNGEYYVHRDNRQLKKYLDNEGVPLLKLHGSANFVVCGNFDCQRFEGVEILPTYEAGREHMYSCPRCRQEAGKLVVPPVWSKKEYQAPLQTLWNRAVRELLEAEQVVILGYSLPAFDFTAKHLLTLTSRMNPDAPWVIANGSTFDDAGYSSVYRGKAGIENTLKYFKEFTDDLPRH